MNVLVGYADECLLLGREVGGLLKTLNRCCYQREGGTQVVRDIGEERQFGVCRILQLRIEALEVVSLLFKDGIALSQNLFRAFFLPVQPQQQEECQGAQEEHHNENPEDDVHQVTCVIDGDQTA